MSPVKVLPILLFLVLSKLISSDDESFLKKFQQNDYKIKFEWGAVHWYDKSLYKYFTGVVFKYNRTQTAANVTWQFIHDVDYDLMDIHYAFINFYPEERKLPPLLPNGRYNISFNLRFQNKDVALLSKNHFTCPKPVKNRQGCYYSLERLVSGEHIVRLLEFLPGRILNEISPTNSLYYDIGKYIASFDTTLENFHHPAYDSRNMLWMLNNVSKLSDFLHVVDVKEDSTIVQEVMREFDSRVLKIFGTLKKGIIHGDFNEQNILVDKIDGEWKLAGILDFGDSQRTCYLFELAIVMTYMIILAKDLVVGGHVLAGYSSVRSLTDQEFSLLKVCVAARLCQSLVIGKYTSELDPDNKYILSTADAGWHILRKLWNEPEEEVLDKWRNVALSYKN